MGGVVMGLCSKGDANSDLGAVEAEAGVLHSTMHVAQDADFLVVQQVAAVPRAQSHPSDGLLLAAPLAGRLEHVILAILWLLLIPSNPIFSPGNATGQYYIKRCSPTGSQSPYTIPLPF